MLGEEVSVRHVTPGSVDIPFDEVKRSDNKNLYTLSSGSSSYSPLPPYNPYFPHEPELAIENENSQEMETQL